MIYFMDDRKLAAELRDGAVPSLNKFIYFMLATIWMLISSSASFNAWDYEPPTRLDRFADLVVFVVSVLGFILCYDINREGDDRDYIERVTCLGFPIFVQVTLLGGLIVVPGLLLRQYVYPEIEKDLVFFIANLVVVPYSFWRLYTAIRIAAFPKPGPEKAI
ncbi:MAG: hypothetical protein JWM96_937 [Alphaproteobacteria bacterium]|nr:hypothetical protein [Alphaproteobacteria bacterium]